jgi:hypothetical protein
MLKFAVGGNWVENLYRPASNTSIPTSLCTSDEGVVTTDGNENEQDKNANPTKVAEDKPKLTKIYANVPRRRPPSTLAEAKLRASLRTSAYRNQLHRTTNLIDNFFLDIPTRYV